MNVFRRLAYKDFLVLIRDKSGLAMLFLMPMALVLIMTSLQNNTFKAINESGIKLIILNNDQDSLGTVIENEIKQAGIFQVYSDINGKKPDEAELKEAVASGKYQIGIVIPSGATGKIRELVKSSVERIFSGDTTSRTIPDSLFIMLYADPATKSSMRSTLQGTIREYSSKVESRIVLNELTREINARMMTSITNLNLMRLETVFYKEEYVAKGNKTIIPNAVQHNVPAWTLFAMFFIVIPFASAMIKEREDGSLSRLLTMPCSYFSIMISRVFVYLLVTLLQFVLILLMGVYLFPLIGLPALMVEGHLVSLSTIAVAAGLGAIGYGVAVGTIARTHQQAAIFASISVVILAALGGIWVPVFVMPPFLREISIISPLNWGMNGFYDILVRNARFSEIYLYGIGLVIFSAVCLLVAYYYQKITKEYN